MISNRRAFLKEKQQVQRPWGRTMPMCSRTTRCLGVRQGRVGKEGREEQGLDQVQPCKVRT